MHQPMTATDATKPPRIVAAKPKVARRLHCNNFCHMQGGF
jgi:hypothetical protein